MPTMRRKTCAAAVLLVALLGIAGPATAEDLVPPTGVGPVDEVVDTVTGAIPDPPPALPDLPPPPADPPAPPSGGGGLPSLPGGGLPDLPSGGSGLVDVDAPVNACGVGVNVGGTTSTDCDQSATTGGGNGLVDVDLPVNLCGVGVVVAGDSTTTCTQDATTGDDVDDVDEPAGPDEPDPGEVAAPPGAGDPEDGGGGGGLLPRTGGGLGLAAVGLTLVGAGAALLHLRRRALAA